MKRHLSYHACTGVSLTTSNYLVTRSTSYTTGLHDNNRGVRNSRCTGHMHSILNETGFETQSVSITNVVIGYMKIASEADRGLSPSSHFLLPWGISASREHGAFCFSTVYKLKVGKFVQFWLWLLLRVKGYKNHQLDLESELFSFQPFQSTRKHFSQNHSACRLAAMIWFRMAKGNGVSRFFFAFFPS